MRILLSTLGTAGDIIPFARMASVLLDRGHEVTVHCPERYAGWFPPRANIVFSGGEIPCALRKKIFEQALCETTAIAQKFHFSRWFYGLGDSDDRAQDYYDRALQTFATHDLALINVLDHIGQITAEHIGLPWVSYMSRPPPDPAVADLQNTDIDTAVSALLSRISNSTCFVRTFRALSPLLTLVACSPNVIPLHPDSSVKLTGAWLNPQNSRPLPLEMEAFLSKGPTLFSTFGNLPDINGRTKAIIKAIQMSGWQAIVQVIASASLPASGHEGIFITHQRLPFDTLFSRVNAVVHHGGSGTTHEILRAGLPSFAIPHMGDQPFWGFILQYNELGPPPIQHTEIEVNKLAEQMAALKQKHYIQNAKALGPAIAGEDGLTHAADLLESVLQKTT
jgi:UDP:flavonoid glycosyltransferase YjiC (YdhE family)